MSSLETYDGSDWQANASCAGEMASCFYPPLRAERKAARLSRESRAKAVCAECPVRSDCLDHATNNDERYGIWGGMTDRERRMAAAPLA